MTLTYLNHLLIAACRDILSGSNYFTQVQVIKTQNRKYATEATFKLFSLQNVLLTAQTSADGQIRLHLFQNAQHKIRAGFAFPHTASPVRGTVSLNNRMKPKPWSKNSCGFGGDRRGRVRSQKWPNKAIPGQETLRKRPLKTITQTTIKKKKTFAPIAITRRW